jgi:hypothetical protein
VGQTASEVYFLNGGNGTFLPYNQGKPFYVLCGQWSGAAVGDLNRDGTDDFVVGLSSAPGWVTAINGANERTVWQMVPSLRGVYTLSWQVPMNALFGPYIVELEVQGTQKINGVNVTIDDRVVNYFMVTPPNGKMPASPVYTVQLITWYDDWDFAPGAGNPINTQLPTPTSAPSPLSYPPGYQGTAIY